MLSLLLILVVLLLGGLGGFILGQRRGLIWGLQHLENEVAVTLYDDEVASCIRVGDTQRGLKLLDLRVDGAILRLKAAKQNLGFLAAQGEVRPEKALRQAKLYRSVVPTAGGDTADVRSALEEVPHDGETFISPALARLTEHEK